MSVFTMLRVGAFVLFALVVGFFSTLLRRLRVHRARRWKLTSTRYVAVMVGQCTTLPQVHATYLALSTPCPFCMALQRPSFRRTRIGPFVADWYDKPPATEALPDVDDVDGEDVVDSTDDAP